MTLSGYDNTLEVANKQRKLRRSQQMPALCTCLEVTGVLWPPIDPEPL